MSELAMTLDDESRDVIEDLLFDCLEQQDPAAAIEQACEERPDAANILRQRFAVLQGMGMVECPGSLEEGTSFGVFKLLEELGRGGMGVVYLADQPALNRQVALKVIREDYLKNPRAQKRFRREIEAVSRLDHPGICTVYDAGEVDGTPYIAMRYVRGQTLGQRLAARRRATGSESGSRYTQMEVHATLVLIEKVARALHAAHEAGVVHRDVKPGNILVTDDDEPVLLDFGLARETESTDVSITMTGDVVGTPAYMAPEQIAGHGAIVDRRSDVYSLGVALFECLSMRLPFSAPTREGLYREILAGRRLELRRHNPAVSRDLQLVLETAMARDADHRYATALDFAEDLRRVRSLQPIAARRPSASGRAWRWARREPLKASLTVVLLALLIGSSGLVGYIASQREAVRVGEASLRLREFERRIANAFMALRREEIGLARADLDAAERSRPGDLLVLFGRAIADCATGSFDAAVARIDRSAFAPDAKTRLRAYVMMRRGRALEARDLVADLTSGESAEELILEARVSVLHRPSDRMLLDPVVQKQEKRAYELILRGILKSPRASLHHHVFLADAAANSGIGLYNDYCIDALTTLYPNEPIAVQAAIRCLTAVDPHRGMVLAREARRRWPGHTRIRRLIAGLHDALGDTKQAIDEMQELIRAVDRPTPSWFEFLTRLQDDAGDLDGAAATVRAAMKCWPDNPNLVANNAAILMRRGRLKDAGDEYARAMKLRGDEDPFLLARSGDLFRQLREFEKAEKAILRAIELDPQEQFAHHYLGRLRFDQGRYEEALTAFEAAQRLLPNHHMVHLMHAQTAVKLRKLDLAKTSFEKALALEEDAPNAHYLLGWINQQQRDIAAAKRHYRSVEPGDPSYPMALCNLAMILAHSGNANEALPIIRKAHRIGSQRKTWNYRSADWVREVERLKEQQAGKR